ncbi:MAG: hypothetical protein SGCHY_005272, partial [Lobulomycetales sp.]
QVILYITGQKESPSRGRHNCYVTAEPSTFGQGYPPIYLRNTGTLNTPGSHMPKL